MDDVMMFLVPFLISFFASLLFLSVLVFFSKKIISHINRKGKRHIHKKNNARIGGLGIIAAFWVALFMDSRLVFESALWGVFFASLLILIFGIIDDFFELDWKTQLFFQIAAVLLIFIFGVQIEYISNPIGGVISLTETTFIPALIFIIVWVLIIMNSVNWIDGVDGLSGGVALIGILTIFFLSMKPEVNQPPIGIITAALVGSILGFLLLNYYPSRIFAGTSGSMFLGFMIAVLAIFAGTKIATTLLIMSIPILDAIWVIIDRIRNGESIFKADNRHLHHKLLELGWSQQKICFLFYSITGIIAIIALNTRSVGKLITILLVFLVMTFFVFFVNKKIESLKKEHELQF